MRIRGRESGIRPDRPLILAHRGASGYEYENSPAAFRRAESLGADGVELDVHATREGDLVVHHDRTITGAGPIDELTLAEVERVRLPNGEGIPLLHDVLEILRGLVVWVEVKTLPTRYDQRLVEVLDRGPSPAGYGVHSFDHRILARLCRLRPNLRRGILLSAYPLDHRALITSVAATALWQEWQLIDDNLVKLVHRAGGMLIAWTVDGDADCARLARMGVDALCTNYPDRARAAVERLPV